MKFLWFDAGLFVAFFCIALTHSSGLADERPNVLLIMADDLGFSDVGCFGSEIQTPHIDSIARDGLQFTRFRATPMCVTSRIALMSGMPMHLAGQHNYSGATPLAKQMKSAGYRTLMTGKWHAGIPDPRDPELFDRSFGFLGGATDSFIGGDDWFSDDQPFDEFDTDFYATDAFAQRSIEFMKESVDNQQPFFMYVAFNAPHHPCQAPRATVEKYRKTYHKGYDVLRKERRSKQQRLGIDGAFGDTAKMGNEVRRWEKLSPHRKDVEAERMAAYAAAVDEVDQNVGRMLKYLEQAGIQENTLVIFLSDNGGDYSNGSIEGDELQTPWLPKTNPSSSNGWASVKCTPFRYYKHSCHEGGIATPMVLRWPAGVKRPVGTVIDSATNITDIYPTLLELAGAASISKHDESREHRTTGQSLLPLFKTSGTRDADPSFFWYSLSKAWVEDEWKAVRLYDGPWQLFNLQNDRCESNDLAEAYPDRVKAFAAKWETFAVKSNVPNAKTKPIPQRGWGWHRLERACRSLQATSPENGATTESTEVDLSIQFGKPIKLGQNKSLQIALFDVSDESKPVWKAQPNASHLKESQSNVLFTDLPELKPDTTYCVRWDGGWIKVGGEPIGVLNDGAYWWRFRTPAKSK
jgi:arylsulfatase